jgi:NAD(P)H-dependent FMN reductase
MQLAIICGSHRRASQSGKVSRYVADRAIELGMFHGAQVLDLAETEIPFWDEDVWDSSNTDWKAVLTPINDLLSAAHAYVVVSPEWNGMVPAKLKNFLLFPGAAVVGHKPALITAVSAGRGGAYPVNELRTSGYKNGRICYIPEHLIVRNVEQVLNTGDAEAKEDVFIRSRIDFALGVLGEYARVMSGMNRDLLISKEHRNGM